MMQFIKNILILISLSILIFSCEHSITNSKEDLIHEQKVKKLELELKAYMKEKGLDPNDISITNPVKAAQADAETIRSIKDSIDNYAINFEATKKQRERYLERAFLVGEKMKKAQTDKDIEAIKQEYPEFFISASQPDTIKKN